MPDSMFVTGVVGTPPVTTTTRNGMTRLQFRLGSSQRKYNKEAGAFEYGETNWYTVVAFRRLAENTAQSITKGDRVVVAGKLRIDEWEREGQRTHTVELIADAIGHDLMFGTDTFVRSASGSAASQAEPSATGVGADVGSPASAGTESTAVDSDGWTLPGAGSDDGTRAGATGTASDLADDADEVEAAVTELEFAGAEPPF